VFTVSGLGDETRALGDLAARGLRGFITLIEGTHAAIAARSFSAAPASAPARLGHDSIASATYGAITGVGGALLRAGATAASAALRAEGSIADSRGGALALGAVNGTSGDQLAGWDSPLAIETQLRHRGERVATSSDELAARFPDAAGRIAVFVHGLCETEHAWWWRAERAHGGETYGSRLRRELGHTPLYVRYNTGRHISDNGRDLARLLNEVEAGWPVAIEEIVLVGHSMGGLVVRSACHAARDDGHEWPSRVRHAVYLGSPHTGADLEKAAHVAAWSLGAVPETRAFASAIDGRSSGIQDLRFGYLLEEDWWDRDPAELLRCYRGDVPFLDTATHYFIAASLTRDSSHPVGRVAGDLLVRRPSAWADGQHPIRERFDLERSRSLGPLTHFDLLNHPEVYAHMREWLGRRAQ
jgi:pimeloyl-ACP methyl ester carboxylesterase